MSNYTVHNDRIYFHPGYFIQEDIEACGMNQREYAAKLGTTPKTLSKIINGEQGITADIARKLNAVTGSNGEFWLNVQDTYDYALVNIKAQSNIEDEIDIVKKLCYSYFVEYFDLPPFKRQLSKQVFELQTFIGVPDLRILQNESVLTSFRKKPLKLDQQSIIKCNALLYVAQNMARDQVLCKWSKQKLIESLDKIAALSIDSNNYKRNLEQSLNKLGLAFVSLPHLKGSGLNGAVKKFNKNVLIVITDRGKTYDTFWFTLFHELSHVINGDYGVNLKANHTTKREKCADEAAANYLIDKEKYSGFLKEKDFSANSILNFAKEIKRHPSIIAGRLCHDGWLPYKSKVATSLRNV